MSKVSKLLSAPLVDKDKYIPGPYVSFRTSAYLNVFYSTLLSIRRSAGVPLLCFGGICITQLYFGLKLLQATQRWNLRQLCMNPSQKIISPKSSRSWNFIISYPPRSIIKKWNPLWWTTLRIPLRGIIIYISKTFPHWIVLIWVNCSLRTPVQISISHMYPLNHWVGLSISGWIS